LHVAFQIRFSPEVREHLESLSPREQRIVLDEISEQLQHEPGVPTRNRKRLRPNPLAPWALRVGDLRVLYDVDDLEQRVDVLVIGRKVREKLLVAGKEVKP